MNDTDAGDRPPPAPVRPLKGLTVVAVEQYGAAPFGTMYLADLGADVIKIENHGTGGEMGRHVLPYAGTATASSTRPSIATSAAWRWTSRSRAAARSWNAWRCGADALINNLRGDLPATLGLDRASLAGVNAHLVCVHLSAYGRDNERAAWPGLDYVMQAEAGYLSMTGEPDSVPTRFGLSIVDFMGGLTAALALVSGVMRARATGCGMDIDTPLYDVAMNNLSYPATWHLNEGFEPRRVARSGHPSLVPSELYRTADGWLFVMANKANFWPALCRAMERPEWIDDPLMRDFAARYENRDEVVRRLEAVFLTRTTGAWLERLAGVLPCAPVNDVGRRAGERLRPAPRHRAGGAASAARHHAHGAPADHRGRRRHAAQRRARARRRHRRHPRRTGLRHARDRGPGGRRHGPPKPQRLARHSHQGRRLRPLSAPGGGEGQGEVGGVVMPHRLSRPTEGRRGGASNSDSARCLRVR